jgi:agmatine/peptidylarginine deiminase
MRLPAFRTSTSVLVAATLILAAAACQPAGERADAPALTAPTRNTALLRPQVTVVETSPLAETVAQPMLPAYLTAAERVDVAKNDASDDFRNANPWWFAMTKPLPAGEFRPFGEWEKMAEVWTTYSSGMPSTPPVRRMFAEQTINFVRYSDPRVVASVIVSSQKVGDDFFAALDEYGIKEEEKKYVKLVIMPNQTIWHIDYGAFPVLRKSDNVLAFTDFIYYGPRHIDDAIPTRIANDVFKDVTVFRMPFPFEGGNIQTDGTGKCMTSTRALSNTGFSAERVRHLLKGYAGCEETFIVKDITDDGTGHIDMFFKWSAEDEVIFGQYEDEITLDYDGDGVTETLPMPGKVAPDYKDIFAANQKRMNDNAALMAAATSSKGTKFIVHRLPMMTRYKDNYGPLPRTFINSTFTNGVNVYPSYTPKSCQDPNGAVCKIDADCADKEHCAAGKCTLSKEGPTAEGCDELLACPSGQQCVDDPLKIALIAKTQKKWEEAMPDWKHVGLRADTIGLWSGAIHCITRTIPDAPRAKIYDDALCLGGKCGCVEGGADNTCTQDSECFGPAWECNCQICKGNCASDGANCTDDSDCAAKGEPVVAGACIYIRDQSCKGEGKGCGETPWEGMCSGKTLKFCSSGDVKELSCAGCCGWSPEDGSNTCLAGAACESSCKPECEQAGHYGCSAEGTHAWVCEDVGGCLKRKYTTCGKPGCSNATGACNVPGKDAPKCPTKGEQDAGSTDDASGGDDGSGSGGGSDASAGGDDGSGGGDGSTGGPAVNKPAPKSSGCTAAATSPQGLGWLWVMLAMACAVIWRRRLA